MRHIEFEVRDVIFDHFAAIARDRKTTVEHVIEGLCLRAAMESSRPLDEQVRDLHAAGWETSYIAAFLGVPNNRIRDILLDLGLRGNPRRKVLVHA